MQRNVSLSTGFNPTIRAGDIDNIDALNARKGLFQSLAGNLAQSAMLTPRRGLTA